MNSVPSCSKKEILPTGVNRGGNFSNAFSYRISDILTGIIGFSIVESIIEYSIGLTSLLVLIVTY